MARCDKSYSLANTMRSCQHPLISDEHSCAVEHLLGPAEDGGQERPVARGGLHAPHYPLRRSACCATSPAFWKVGFIWDKDVTTKFFLVVHSSQSSRGQHYKTRSVVILVVTLPHTCAHTSRFVYGSIMEYRQWVAGFPTKGFFP